MRAVRPTDSTTTTLLRDPDAFEALYRRLVPTAFTVAFRICRSRQMAEDVTQQAFLEAWRSADQFDPTRGTPATWIFGIVRHRSIDALRRHWVTENRRNREVDIDELAQPHHELVDHAIASDRAAVVRRVLRTLPSAQREVIELAYFDGLTHTEIAELLTVPAGTVKGRMRLGLVKLRAAIAGNEFEPEPLLAAA